MVFILSLTSFGLISIPQTKRLILMQSESLCGQLKNILVLSVQKYMVSKRNLFIKYSQKIIGILYLIGHTSK